MLIRSDSLQLTRHFKLSEFVHHETKGNMKFGLIEFGPDFLYFVHMLEEFRVWYNRPINITSGYRPPAYNKCVGGSLNSAHLKTLAIDFSLPREFFSFDDDRKREFLENVKDKWIEICRRWSYCYQCNFYDTYLHLGVSLDRDSFIDKRSWK